MSLDPRALEAAVVAADQVVDLDDVGEYGYGGEVFPHTVLSNPTETVTAAIEAYLAAVPDHWADLRERLEKAERRLLEMVEDTTRSPMDRLRLEGKAEGVSLALSYLREYRR